MSTSTTPHEAANNSSPTELPSEPQHEATAVLVGGGEMGALMRSIDRAQTPGGPLEMWPRSLPRLVQFYNDGYRPVLGSAKHPAAMGHGAQACFVPTDLSSSRSNSRATSARRWRPPVWREVRIALRWLG